MRSLRLYFFIFFFHPFFSFAQSADDRMIEEVVNKRTIIRNDTLFLFSVAEEDITIRPDLSRNYYWFKKDTILSTIGGFGGRLLNGNYTVYYPDKNLRESGQFHYGLKDGEWKIWNPDGTLHQVTRWKRGLESSAHTDQ